MTFELQQQMNDELHMESQDNIAEDAYIEGKTDAWFGVELDLTKELHLQYIQGLLAELEGILSNLNTVSPNKLKLILKWESTNENVNSTLEEF